jgi:hypothetical protein
MKLDAPVVSADKPKTEIMVGLLSSKTNSLYRGFDFYRSAVLTDHRVFIFVNIHTKSDQDDRVWSVFEAWQCTPISSMTGVSIYTDQLFYPMIAVSFLWPARRMHKSRRLF